VLLHAAAAAGLAFAATPGREPVGRPDGTLLCSLAWEVPEPDPAAEVELPQPESELVEAPDLPRDEPEVPDVLEPPREDDAAIEPVLPAPSLGLADLRTRPRRAPAPSPAAPAASPASSSRAAPRAPLASAVRGRPLRPIAWPRMDATSYPPAALARRIQGTATVDLLVGADGQVVEAVLSSSSGWDVLDRDAPLRAREFRFLPIESPRWARIPMRYVLP
jgi:protein TonB